MRAARRLVLMLPKKGTYKMPKSFNVASAAISGLVGKNRLARSLAFAAVAIGLPGGARAEDNWYARIDIGYSIGGSADIEASAPIGGDVSLDGNVLGSAGIGYAFGKRWRLEGELARRENDLDAAAMLDPGGSISATSLMLNAYYDIGSGDGALTPYVGAGVGAAKVEVDAAFTSPFLPVFIDDDATIFSYQVMAGLAVSVTSHLDLDVGYRYFGAPSIEGTGSAPPVISVPFEAALSHHAVTAGLRWNF